MSALLSEIKDRLENTSALEQYEILASLDDESDILLEAAVYGESSIIGDGEDPDLGEDDDDLDIDDAFKGEDDIDNSEEFDSGDPTVSEDPDLGEDDDDLNFDENFESSLSAIMEAMGAGDTEDENNDLLDNEDTDPSLEQLLDQQMEIIDDIADEVETGDD